MSAMEENELNPRYLAYCAAHGNSPQEMMEADDAAWPGGQMAGFILWIGARWTEWRRQAGLGRNDTLMQAHHDDFDAWLSMQVAA